MIHRFTLLSLAAVLCAAPACIINTTNDDGNDDSNNDTGTTVAPATDTGDPPATSTTEASTEGASSGAADSTSGGVADSTGGTTGSAGSCGWGKTGQKMVPMGYVCGAEGEDPDGMFPAACPEGIPLEDGNNCAGLTGVGCCDANGDAWYCVNDGGMDMLTHDDC